MPCGAFAQALSYTQDTDTHTKTHNKAPTDELELVEGDHAVLLSGGLGI